MAKTILFLALLSVLYPSMSAGTTKSRSASAANFIRTSCSAATYPTLCVQSLAPFATSIQQSSRQLALSALSVSLSRAESTKTFLSKLTKLKNVRPREMAAIKDCLEEISDTVDQLGKSMKELKNAGRAKGPDFQLHMGNVKTWVSGALTDEDTCVDGFAGKALNGKVKNSIKTRIVNVAQVTSNALALINKYASKQ